MQIKIKSPTKQTVYPDIDDNLSLPEDERFGVELRKPSKQAMAESSVRTEFDERGDARTVYDANGRARAWIGRLVNAPTLVIDGRSRKMQIGDLFRWDELAPVLRAVNERIDALTAEDTEEDESKN
jgi:hypothetical protein